MSVSWTRLVCFAALVMLFSCDKSPKEDVEPSPTSTPDLVLTSLPTDQESPVENPAKTGTPAWFRVLLPENGTKLSYRNETSLFSVLVFNAEGQWINSDRDLVIEVTPADSRIMVRAAASQETVLSVTVPSGAPSMTFKLIGQAPGMGAVRFSAPSLSYEGTVVFDVTVSPPQSATNQVNPLPPPETCTKTSYLFDGYFSLTESTSLSLSPMGCAFYSDPNCSLQVATLNVPADRNVSEEIWYKSAGNSFVDFADARTGISFRTSCFAIAR